MIYRQNKEQDLTIEKSKEREKKVANKIITTITATATIKITAAIVRILNASRFSKLIDFGFKKHFSQRKVLFSFSASLKFKSLKFARRRKR